MIEDFLITTNGTERVTLPKPCIQLLLANRTKLFASTDCPNPKLAPVYHCPTHHLCSPFAPVKDKQFVQGCVDCDDYKHGEQPCDSPIPTVDTTTR